MHEENENSRDNNSDIEALKMEYQDYVYKISHDLSAPFRQIHGFANIINKKYSDVFDEKSLRHMQLIINGANKGIDLIEALLELSRVETHANKFQKVNSKISVRNAREMLVELEDASNVNYTIDELPDFQGDKQQICQLFYHLLRNALLYQLPETQAQIHITASDQNNHWQFCISDNGLGIPEKFITEIFHPLKRFNDDQRHEGVGIGLAIANKIVERHNGSLSVESEPGRGSKFYFTVPKEN